MQRDNWECKHGFNVYCAECDKENKREDSNRQLLIDFARDIMSQWTIVSYYGGEICETCKDPKRLVNEFLSRD